MGGSELSGDASAPSPDAGPSGDGARKAAAVLTSMTWGVELLLLFQPSLNQSPPGVKCTCNHSSKKNSHKGDLSGIKVEELP